MANLISSSHFTGHIAIPGIAEPAVASALNTLILLHEDTFLEKVLGRALADLFKAGISVVSPAQKWKDLRDGVIYTYDDRSYRFDGLAPSPASGKLSPIAA